jgi:hypothetical protein
MKKIFKIFLLIIKDIEGNENDLLALIDKEEMVSREVTFDKRLFKEGYVRVNTVKKRYEAFDSNMNWKMF